MPSRRAVLMIRQAISPRLAMRIRLNIVRMDPERPIRSHCGAAGEKSMTARGRSATSYLQRRPAFMRRRDLGNTMAFKFTTVLAIAIAAFALQASAAERPRPRNVILFVPDGLRALSVTPDSTPTMAAVRDKGVNFKNSHSLFPTFTTANASALATGHYLGDTGDFSNTIYTGYPVGPANGTVTPFLEVDPVIID